MKEGEWDSRDTGKNRLTSLHLIGSSCNHKKKDRKKNNRRQMIESRARQEKKTQDSETYKNKRENTATKVSSQR